MARLRCRKVRQYCWLLDTARGEPLTSRALPRKRQPGLEARIGVQLGRGVLLRLGPAAFGMPAGGRAGGAFGLAGAPSVFQPSFGRPPDWKRGGDANLPLEHAMTLSLTPTPDPAYLEPDDFPARRIDRLIDLHPWLEPDALVAAADRIANKHASFRSRWRLLIALADKFNAALGELATCRFRCAYCCSLRTLIYRHEAVLLTRASGREYVELPFRPQQKVLAEIETLPFRPCPFLAGGRCSVYEKRPMICRLHNSFNDNPLDCDLNAPRVSRKGIVTYDPDLIETAYHALIRDHSPQEPWGTIDQFFPD